jgi:hypothetical protein
MNEEAIYKKMPQDALTLIYPLLNGEIEGLEDIYMVEIKLDAPLKHIIDGDDYFILYSSPNQLMSSAKYLFDNNWATINKSQFLKLITVTPEQVKNVLNKLTPDKKE